MERITRETLEARAANFNRRIERTGRRVVVEGRNGGIGLDEYETNGTGQPMSCLRSITFGTKREVADFLHAMMVGFDFSFLVPEDDTHA